jgi:hypothetical protein
MATKTTDERAQQEPRGAYTGGMSRSLGAPQHRRASAPAAGRAASTPPVRDREEDLAGGGHAPGVARPGTAERLGSSKSRPPVSSAIPAAGSWKSAAELDGSVAKRSGSGCASSHSPADAISTSARRTRRQAAISAAIIPPIEWPTVGAVSRPQRGDHVPAVQREVEHVLERVLAASTRRSRALRREHVDSARERSSTDSRSSRPPRRAGRPAARRRPQSSTRTRTPRAVSICCDPCQVTRRSRRARHGRSGATGSGFGHQRRRAACSGHSRAAGITRSANSFEEWRVFSSGMSPMWNQAEHVPTRSSRDHLLHLLAHGVGAAGDDVAVVDQVFQVSVWKRR